MSGKKKKSETSVSYTEELKGIEACEKLDPEFMKAIKGLKATIGSKKITDDDLLDFVKAMRYTISAIDRVVFNESMTMKEFVKKYIGDESVYVSMTNMFELRHNLANKRSDIEDYLALKRKASYKQAMLDAGCTLSIK